MKNLTFASLKGTKTAIHCMTPHEAEQVEKICGFEHMASNWLNYSEKFCIGTDDDSISYNGEYGPIGYYEKDSFTIIPAADFIAANSVKIDVTDTNVGDIAKKPDSIKKLIKILGIMDASLSGLLDGLELDNTSDVVEKSSVIEMLNNLKKLISDAKMIIQ